MSKLLKLVFFNNINFYVNIVLQVRYKINRDNFSSKNPLIFVRRVVTSLMRRAKKNNSLFEGVLCGIKLSKKQLVLNKLFIITFIVFEV